MKTYSSHTPSRRNMTGSDYTGLSDVRPHKPLLKRLKSHAGRNSQGRITTSHQGGGNKKMYRMVDFKQNRLNAKAVVETLEYDPYRTAFIALVKNDDGSKSYVLAPEGLKVGAQIVTAESTPLTTGNRMKLKNIPVGYQVFNVVVDAGGGRLWLCWCGSCGARWRDGEGGRVLRWGGGEGRRVLRAELGIGGGVTSFKGKGGTAGTSLK